MFFCKSFQQNTKLINVLLERTGVVCPSVYGLSAELPGLFRTGVRWRAYVGLRLIDLDIARSIALHASRSVPASGSNHFTISAVFTLLLGHPNHLPKGIVGQKKYLGVCPGHRGRWKRGSSKLNGHTPLSHLPQRESLGAMLPARTGGIEPPKKCIFIREDQRCPTGESDTFVHFIGGLPSSPLACSAGTRPTGETTSSRPSTSHPNEWGVVGQGP